MPGRSYSLEKDLSQHSKKVGMAVVSLMILLTGVLGILLPKGQVIGAIILMMLANLVIDASAQYSANQKIDFSQTLAAIFCIGIPNGIVIYRLYQYLKFYSWLPSLLIAGSYSIFMGFVYTIFVAFLHRLIF